MTKSKLLAGLCAVLALAACSKKPSNTLIDMNNELCKTGDVAVMAKYVSERAKPAISATAALMAEPKKAAMMKTEIQKSCQDGKAKIDVLSETIDGDRASISYKENDGSEKTAKLVKENGEWKLDLDTNK